MAEDARSHPIASPPSLNFQFQRPWSILRPRLYRFLESQYVDAFFKDGSLRLSSFEQFSKHPDEQRRDTQEGFGHRVGFGPNLTISTMHGRGRDCYVMCGTIHNTENARSLFPQYNGCIAIDNITAFAGAVSTKIPFAGGLEGLAIYQDSTTIMKALGDATPQDILQKYKNPDGTVRMEMLQDAMNTLGGPEEFFLKHSRYAAQCEYRVIWSTGQTVSPFIDIKVPEAIQHCRKVTTEC
jgi:hypothetical protein